MPVTSEQIRLAPSHPVLVIRNAVEWARAAGLTVRLGPWGIVCASLAHPRWVADPHGRSRVDPVAAAVLHRQPDVDDIEAAISEALSAPSAWCAGFEAALNREEPSIRWAEQINRRLYLGGAEAGIRYRAEFLCHLRSVQ